MLRNIRTYWRDTFDDWWFIFRRELRVVFTDAGVLLFFILVPLFYPLLYSAIYTTEVIRDVPICVVDQSHTALSREYLRRVDATPDVQIVAHCASIDDAQELMRRREVYGVVCVPKEFADNVARGEQAHVSVYSDMSGLLYYKSLLLANTNVSLAMNAEIKAQRAPQTTAEQDRAAAQPIGYAEVNLYNPQGGMGTFLLPGALVLIIQQTLLLGIGLIAGTSRESNRLHELTPVERHHNGLLRIVLAKAFVYLLIYAVQSTFCFAVVPRLFGFPQIGSPLTLAFFFLPFLLAVIFFGMTISAVIRERENVVLAFVFLSVLLLFISGMSWPATAIPDYLRAISYVFPSTFGINGFIHINTMGATLLEVRREWDALWLQTAIYFFTCALTYRYKLLGARSRLLRKYKEQRRQRGS